MTVKLIRIVTIASAIALTVLWSGASGITSSGPDTHGPMVNVTSGYMTDSSDYTLAGSIRGYADLKKLTVTVNGGQEQVVPLAAEFKLPVKLNAGQNEILLKTVDSAGHTATNMVIVTFQGSGQGGAFSVSQSALASWQKMQKKQMQALRKALAKEPEPAATQSTAESLKALNNSAAELRKTLASLGAATTPTPESTTDTSVAEKKSPPEKRIDITAPLIEITSPSDTTSTNYLLTGSATDDTGVTRLTASLNKNKPMPIKLDHGQFRASLQLTQGINVVRIIALDVSGHETVQDLHVVVKPATSAQLIDAAVARGRLDKNKALMYKVFAAFGDPRLPEKFASQRSGGSDNHILDEVAARLPTLPRPIQKKLIPFFMPPYYKGSWFDRALDHTADMTSSSVGASFGNRGEVHIEPAVIRHYVNPISHAYPPEGFKPLLVSGPGQIPLPGGNESPGYSKSGWGLPPCLTMRTDGFHFVNCHISFKWRHVDGKHVRVWYLNKLYKSDEVQPDTNDWKAFKGPAKFQAEEVRDQAEDVIWPKLTKLMGRKPLSDADVPLNGGDGRLDIALTPGILKGKATNLGLTIPYLSYSDKFWGKACKPNPVYIELRRTLPLSTLLSDLSHEIMHSIQWTYHTKGCLNEYRWLMESTAVWAQDYVYPKINWEHWLAAYFIKHPETPLETVGGKHEYSSYLFFFYLRWHLKSADIVRKTWEATLKEPSGIQAAADALKAYKKNMEKIFPLFAVTNLNDGPIHSYTDWDGIGGPEDVKNHIDANADYEWTDVHLGRYGSISLPFFADGKGLSHLSARHFAFSFKGVPARSVAIFNGYGYKLSRITRKRTGIVGNLSESRLANSDVWAVTTLPPKDRKGRHLEALVNIDHEWKKGKNDKPYVDVGPGIAFCGNSSDKHLDALILVASNSRMPGKNDVLAPRGDPPLVYASNMGCGPWKGTIEANDDGTSSEHGQWTFTTNFTTGPMGSDSAPITTEGQLKKAIAGGMPSSGVGDMNDIAGFLSGGAGKGGPAQNGTAGAGMPFGWPTRGRFIPPFGAILSFGTGVTKWSAEYPNCGRTSGEYKDFIVVWTYNFVRSGDLYRHYVLLFAPVPWWSLSGLPYRVWDPESKSCDMGHRDPPGQPFMGTMENDGVHAQGSVSGPDYEAGDGSANYYFHLQTGAGKQ